MANGFFSLGEMIVGGGIDREGARLEGLDLGSKIQARRATTVNALAQARLRVDEEDAKLGLADAIEAMGLPPEMAVHLRAGGKIKDLTGGLLEQQEAGFRENIADIAVPFEQRQASAQAVEGKVVDPFQFGPGGDLFADVFTPGDAPELSATGPSAIAADVELAEKRRQEGLLAEARRLNPDHFKSSTTINLGSTTPLAEQILPGGKGVSIIPKGFTAEEGLGAEAFFKGGVNALSDFIGFGTQFPEEALANAVLGELSGRIQITMRADVFRPNVQIQQLLGRYAEEPRQLFRGDDIGRQNFNTTLAAMKRTFKRTQDQLNSPVDKTKTRFGQLEKGLLFMADTIADLEAVEASFQRTEGDAPLTPVAPATTRDIGVPFDLPSGGTATRIE